MVAVRYTSAVYKVSSPTVYIQEDFCGKESCAHFALNPHGRDMSPTWNGLVAFGQSATEDQKRAAWGLNLECIAIFHSCQDISQLLPTIWKLTNPGAVSSRIRSSADSIADASQTLPE
jgi:hypothetical protein